MFYHEMDKKMPKKIKQSSKRDDCLKVLFTLYLACIGVVPNIPYALEFLRI